MRNLKAFLSAVLITTATFAATACSSKDSSSSTDIIMDEEKRTKLFEIAENEDLLKGEIENKKIKWLSNWDINPDVNSGKYTPPDLALFKEIYGGEIEYIACTKSDLLYDKLAKSISSGEGVDFFYGGNLDAFPRGALNDNNWFVPADDYIDFDSVLWKDIKAANDELLWGGKHYLAITQVLMLLVSITERLSRKLVLMILPTFTEKESGIGMHLKECLKNSSVLTAIIMVLTVGGSSLDS